MNMIKMSCAAMLFAYSILQINLVTAAEPEPGFISIYGNGKFLCRLKIEEGQKNLHEDIEDCRDIPFSEGSFKLENVRSAASIILSSNLGNFDPNKPVGCNDTRGFKVILRTLKNDLTTNIISTGELKTHEVNRPLVPGLLLKEKTFGAPHNPPIRCLTIRFD